MTLPNDKQAESRFRTYECRCGQIVVSSSPPEPIRWSDGHICTFAENRPAALNVGAQEGGAR